MKSIGFDREELAKMKTLQEDDRALERRTFNLVFAGTLLWGFLLNFIIVKVASQPIKEWIFANAQSARGIVIGILIGYLACVFCGSMMMRSRSTATCFAGFNLIAVPVGIVVSIVLLAYENEPDVVSNAFLLTAGITGLMILLSVLFPDYFKGIGKLLFLSLMAVIAVDVICMLFFGHSFGLYDYLVAGLMCLYIGFDWGRASECAPTPQNAIGIAASLYLDIINLFLRLLSILSKAKSRD